MSKNALVSGGTRGIGAAIAEALKNNGYNVVVNYSGNEAAATAFTEKNGIQAIKWDVSNYESCKNGIEEAKKILGGEINVLVNNAGITRDSMFHKMQPQQWLDVINTNLNSMFFMCNLVIQDMRDKKFGRIINISSINGSKGQVGQTNYSAAKAGVIGFTKALAQESANKGITVNAIAPGYIATDMTSNIPQEVLDKIVHQIPVGRMGLPEEIANTVLFLASEKAGFITGATMHVNGGQYLT